MSEFIFKQECHKIVACAMEVLNAIGRGFHDVTRLRAVDRGMLNRKWTQINANANSGIRVYLCPSVVLKKEVKSTVKTTAGLDHYWCSFKPL